MEKDPTQVQDLHRVLPDILDAMLGNLLAESPGTNRLHYILEHINYWIVPRVSRERARAIRSSMALLRSTITLPAFDDSGH
ncbi:maestro heat-like repeat family member 5 [Natator depressus]|uniref:maestro heat-like repeat family member 5 n=1 Tax=Natator depressus TaxID=27790 RepID=UPI003EBD583E